MAFYDNKKSRNLLRPRLLFSFGSGGWNRTNGLQVMSLTSYHCSTPQHFRFTFHNISRNQKFFKSFFLFFFSFSTFALHEGQGNISYETADVYS